MVLAFCGTEAWELLLSVVVCQRGSVAFNSPLMIEIILLCVSDWSAFALFRPGTKCFVDHLLELGCLISKSKLLGPVLYWGISMPTYVPLEDKEDL